MHDGTFRAEPLRLGLADGIVAVERNPRLAGAIPAQVEAELAALESSIRSGELVVPRGAF